MKRSRFTEEQIVYALRQVESCTPIRDVSASCSFLNKQRVWQDCLQHMTLPLLEKSQLTPERPARHSQS